MVKKRGKPFRAMLADDIPDEKLEDIVFPMIASPKLDGIRCLIDPIAGGPVSREPKPCRNPFIWNALSSPEFAFLDGEVMSPNGFKDSQAMWGRKKATELEPFNYHVFDDFTYPDDPFTARQARLRNRVASMSEDAYERVKVVPHTVIVSLDDLLKYEKEQLDAGHEGVMLRDPGGVFKFGRATFKTRGLLKLKRFVDAEAVIVRVEEEMENANEATKNVHGLTRRTSHKANKIPKGRAGKFAAKWEHEDFSVSSFTDDEKNSFWALRDKLPGTVFTFKYQMLGSKGGPRHPVFLGIRYDRSAEDVIGAEALSAILKGHGE